MEPFGLFQFLSSLLQNSPQSTDAAQNQPSAYEPPKDAPQADAEKKEPFSASENAFLQFLAAHDARAGKFRK